MATVNTASDVNKQTIILEKIKAHSLLASNQDSIHIVENLPDYLPTTDLERFPRRDVHRPKLEDNKGNAWAWKVRIEGAKEGPLKGVSMALKENIAVKDVPMLFGTNIFEDYVPDVDATVVTRLLEAGTTILGKAVCENLSLCASSFSAATGLVENPYATGYSCGGSSSGCGHLVGAGKVNGAIGGDQGGSIRFPASHCGAVGMKPTWGLVPWTGMATHEPVHDTTGPMTLDVATNARILQAIAGRDGIDDRGMGVPKPTELPDYSAGLNLGVKGLKIGILKEGFEFKIMDPRIRERVREAANKFKDLGAEVIQISIPLHTHAADIVTCALRPSAAQNGYLGQACGRRGLYLNGLVDKMIPLDQQKFDKMFSTSKFSLLSGLYIWEHHPLLYGKAMNLYRQLTDSYNAALSQVDFFITPTMPYVAPKHAAPDAGPLERMGKSRGFAVNTVCFNASGHPAMSLPIGMLSAVDDENVMLPVGMQITGKWFDERMIYRVGAAWERGFDWKNGERRRE
ncbi:related to amidase [Phialocephala subalpina]|uniref:Related to amidase n=1 Tax=Phialocephala subalpina TaxID=576137 RepID=A0A1L7XT87_9HELO|nr:related to amidase [Phialocephala subalpina]